MAITSSGGLVSDSVDTVCVDALVSGRLAYGIDVLAQRLYHRLITPPGDLMGGEDEANFGIDLPGFVGSSDPVTAGTMIPVLVTNELLKDPSVASIVDVQSTQVVNSDKTVAWNVNVDVASSLGTIELVLNVSSVTVQLLGVSPVGIVGGT